jgi:hypothetical protein
MLSSLPWSTLLSMDMLALVAIVICRCHLFFVRSVRCRCCLGGANSISSTRTLLIERVM